MKHFPLIRNITLALFVCIAMTEFTSAQNRTIVEVEVANNDTPSKTKLGVKNAIKLNPLLFFRGDVPIYYERALTDKIGIEIGVGMTIRDYISNLTTFEGVIYQDNVIIETRLGYSFNLGMRYYASNYIYQPEGVYFGVDYRHQKYNATVESAGTITYNKDIHEQNNDIRLLLGYVNYFEENVFIDYYAGFGVREKTYDKVVYQNNTPINTLVISNQKALLPYLSLGFKVGMTF